RVGCDGGAGHVDAFELNRRAPAEVRGEFRPVATRIPGIQICEQFSRLAQQMDKVCLIRSMTSDLGEHNFGRHYLLTGYRPSAVLEYPSFGAVMSECRGGRPVLPAYIAVPHASREAGNGYLAGSRPPFPV